MKEAVIPSERKRVEESAVGLWDKDAEGNRRFLDFAALPCRFARNDKVWRVQSDPISLQAVRSRGYEQPCMEPQGMG